MDDEKAKQIAMRVSVVTIICNLLLSFFKLAAGLLGHSGAMISDAVHSASDVFSTIVAILGINISKKKSDQNHQYGHDRLECVAAIVLAVILFLTGVGIGIGGIKNIISGISEDIAVPGAIALAAAILSILIKEWMYWYTRKAAKKINSGALMADAWHHRSDALSSVGALIGIAGARMGYPVLDSIASLVICVFILKAACDIFKDAIGKMVDHSCGEEMEQELLRCASEQSGVLGVDLIQTRIFGNKIYVDIEICADGQITLAESHAIAEQVHAAIETQFSKVKHIMVHVNPAQPALDLKTQKG